MGVGETDCQLSLEAPGSLPSAVWRSGGWGSGGTEDGGVRERGVHPEFRHGFLCMFPVCFNVRLKA